MIASDRPVQTKAEDLLGLGAFVSRLADVAVNWPDDESVVIGLYGEWGSGKTSLLNLLDEELASRGRAQSAAAVLVRFNPWLYGTQETLLAWFFATLAKALKTAPLLSRETRDSAAKAITDLGNVSAPLLSLSLGSPLVGGLWKFLTTRVAAMVGWGQRDLAEQKRLAENALKQLSAVNPRRRVVVLLDDLDRLDGEEVRLVLKLVKLLADLPNISYLIAMDPTKVAAVLAAAGHTGHAYLEKIVQVPIHVPHLDPDRLRSLTLKGIQERLAALGILSSNEQSPLPRWAAGHEYHYDEILRRRIGTLRDLVRFMNNLGFLTAPAETRLEINGPDVVLLSFVQTFFPALIERIRRNRAFLLAERDPFTSGFHAERESRDAIVSAAQERLREVVGVASGTLDASTSHSVCLAVLERLFPYATLPDSPSDHERTQDRLHNRIRSPERFDRYFRLSAGRDEVSDQAVAHWRAGLTSGTASETRLAEIFDAPSTSVESFMNKLRDRLTETSGPECVAVLRVMTVAVTRNRRESLLSFVLDVSERLFRTIHDAGESDPLWSNALDVLKRLISAIPSNDEALLLAARLARIAEGRLSHPKPLVGELSRSILTRMLAVLDAPLDFAKDHDYRDFSNLIWRMRDLSERAGTGLSELKAAVHEMSNAPELLPKVLALGAVFGKGPYFGSELGPQETIASLSKLADPRDLYSKALTASKAQLQSDPWNLVDGFIAHVAPVLDLS